MKLDDIWILIEKGLVNTPFLKDFMSKVMEEQQKIGKVNILIAGKTGVGKTTLVNAVFGENVAPIGSGRPVTQEIEWHEPPGLPVRLCDIRGLELLAFEQILADLEAEIEKGIQTGRVEDRVHILWLCISEPGGRSSKRGRGGWSPCVNDMGSQ